MDGEKAWVTNGVFADLCCVYAQTDPSQGARGIAALLVSAGASNVERLPAEAMLGGHAMGAARLRFNGCPVAAGDVLAAPGRGFAAAMISIDVARVLLGAMCCGLLRDSLEHAVRYASTRRAFGRVIAEFQGLQWSLADVATELAAARALTYETARGGGRGRRGRRGLRAHQEVHHGRRAAWRGRLHASDGRGRAA